MTSYTVSSSVLSSAVQRTKMRVCGYVWYTLLSLLLKQQQTTLCLNVDQAREALSAADDGSYSMMHSPSSVPNQERTDEAIEDDEDEAEDTAASFVDEADDAEDEGSSDDKYSLLEDMESSDLDDEDYDLDAMDDEDAKMIADSMQADEQKAFLQRWEEHKSDRQANGNPDKHGTFAEF